MVLGREFPRLGDVTDRLFLLKSSLNIPFPLQEYP